MLGVAKNVLVLVNDVVFFYLYFLFLLKPR